MTPKNNPFEKAAAELRAEKIMVNIGWVEDQGGLYVKVEAPLDEFIKAKLQVGANLSGLYIIWAPRGQQHRLELLTPSGAVLIMMYRHPREGG